MRWVSRCGLIPSRRVADGFIARSNYHEVMLLLLFLALQRFFQTDGFGKLDLFFVEAQELLEAEFQSGSDMKDVGGTAPNGFVVGTANFLGAAKGFIVVEGDVNQKELRIEVFFDFAKDAGAVGTRDAFRPDEEANGITNFQAVLWGERKCFADTFHVRNGAVRAVRFRQIEA